ncbi:MAG: DUF92 domain-containing protein [Candidatus Hodarchaeota archaeon]
MELWVGSFVYGILLASFLNAPIGFFAYKKEWLEKEAVIAAFFVSLIAFLASFVFWILLIVFFISSSVLTKWRGKRKKEVAEKFEKTGKRDKYQVIANGFAATLMAAFFLITNNSCLVLGYLAAISNVTGDTWATEIGVFSKEDPRWILNPKKRVLKGTSGGVSLLGTMVAFTASLFIFSTYFLVDFIGQRFSSISSPETEIFPIFIATIIGFSGVMIDSFLGATIQGYYECKKCKVKTEKRVHCGEITGLIRGKEWFNNDMVNLSSSMIAVVLALIFSLFLL